MSKAHRAITFSATPELVERINREVVRRTVERGGSTSVSEVLRDAIDRGLGDGPKAA